MSANWSRKILSETGTPLGVLWIITSIIAFSTCEKCLNNSPSCWLRWKTITISQYSEYLFRTSIHSTSLFDPFFHSYQIKKQFTRHFWTCSFLWNIHKLSGYWSSSQARGTRGSGRGWSNGTAACCSGRNTLACHLRLQPFIFSLQFLYLIHNSVKVLHAYCGLLNLVECSKSAGLILWWPWLQLPPPFFPQTFS